MKQSTRERNREIFASIEAGQSLLILAAKYGLALATLRGIIASEKHKYAVSGEAFYEGQRQPYNG